MRKNVIGVLLVSLLALVLISGCAKKTVLKDETLAKESAKPAVKAPEKSDLKPAAPAKAEWEKKWEAMEKARKEKEALAKKEATAKNAKSAAQTKVAPAKEMYELSDILFDFDKFTLREGDRNILKNHAEWLNKNKDVAVAIEGHCDERGTAEYNLALGERRASSAAKYLADLGIEEKRIKTVSYGFNKPLDPGHNEQAWAKNRRAHFVAGGKK